MKITRRQLRRIIKESMDDQEMLNEGLRDLYKQAGMKVPSKQERIKILDFLGQATDADSYRGTAAQNIKLEKLIKQAGGPKALAKKMGSGSGSSSQQAKKPQQAKQGPVDVSNWDDDSKKALKKMQGQLQKTYSEFEKMMLMSNLINTDLGQGASGNNNKGGPIYLGREKVRKAMHELAAIMKYKIRTRGGPGSG